MRPIPQCATCAHLVIDPERTCTAFPEKIPDEIWWNKVDHRQPVAGDGGLQWESLDGATFPEYALS